MDKKKLGSLVGLVGTCGILTVAGLGYFGQDQANDARANYALESSFIRQVDGQQDLQAKAQQKNLLDQAPVTVEVKKAGETKKIEAAEEAVKVAKKVDEAKEEKNLPLAESVSMETKAEEAPAPVEKTVDPSVNDKKAVEVAAKKEAEKKAAQEKAAKEAAEKKAAEEAAKKEAEKKAAEEKAAKEAAEKKAAEEAAKKEAEEKAAEEAAEKKAAEEAARKDAEDKAAQEAAEKKAAEEKAAKEAAEKKAAEEKAAKEAAQKENQAPRLYSLRNLTFHGVIRWNGYKFTYYSQRVLPGRGLRIPGRHVNADGFVADKDGYIVLANSAPKGTVIPTPFGYWGKVYDRGTTGNHFDVYTR